MRRRRASTLAEALVAAVILAVVGGMLVVALAQATQAGQRAMLGAQARRLMQQEPEQVRSGRGIPVNGTTWHGLASGAGSSDRSRQHGFARAGA
ncbi:MAG TPA: type II secretion system protein [bacterium]|nr:type II secretion system protein [bacterium]